MFQPVKQTCKYCTEQNIPFPKYEVQEEEDNLKECYLMESSQEPNAPTVIFFPLISDTFQKYKAPGKPPGAQVAPQLVLDGELLFLDVCSLLTALMGKPGIAPV